MLQCAAQIPPELAYSLPQFLGVTVVGLTARALSGNCLWLKTALPKDTAHIQRRIMKWYQSSCPLPKCGTSLIARHSSQALWDHLTTLLQLYYSVSPAPFPLLQVLLPRIFPNKSLDENLTISESVSQGNQQSE